MAEEYRVLKHITDAPWFSDGPRSFSGEEPIRAHIIWEGGEAPTEEQARALIDEHFDVELSRVAQKAGFEPITPDYVTVQRQRIPRLGRRAIFGYKSINIVPIVGDLDIPNRAPEPGGEYF